GKRRRRYGRYKEGCVSEIHSQPILDEVGSKVESGGRDWKSVRQLDLGEGSGSSTKPEVLAGRDRIRTNCENRETAKMNRKPRRVPFTFRLSVEVFFCFPEHSELENNPLFAGS
ncbi:MAG TPA: hypothetical protein VFZ13_15750, partial [Gemmatimonadales bacterium]